MATRWRTWVPKSWIHSLIKVREWRPFCNRLWDFIMFEEYAEPKSWDVKLAFPHELSAQEWKEILEDPNG